MVKASSRLLYLHILHYRVTSGVIDSFPFVCYSGLYKIRFEKLDCLVPPTWYVQKKYYQAIFGLTKDIEFAKSYLGTSPTLSTC